MLTSTLPETQQETVTDTSSDPPMAFPWDLADLAIENLASGVLIVTYLGYEVRFGRGRKWSNQLEGLVAVVIALAEENPQINEDAVVDRFNGDRPAEYKDRKAEMDEKAVMKDGD